MTRYIRINKIQTFLKKKKNNKGFGRKKTSNEFTYGF